MRVAEKVLSIDDFRSLGAFEIYKPAAVAAFAVSREARENELDESIACDLTFKLGDLFASKTKFLRLLWLARQPGVLPSALMHRYAIDIAKRACERLHSEEGFADIRVSAALAAQQAFIVGESHARAVEPLRQAVRQAAADHSTHGSPRAADACAIVYAALDEDAHEAGAEAASSYLELFPKDHAWVRAHLLELVRGW